MEMEKDLTEMNNEASDSPVSADERKLLRAIRRGGQEGRQALADIVDTYQICVEIIAKQYLNRGLSLKELIEQGNIGLIRAAKKFDDTCGFRFISYAVWWIRQDMLQAISERSPIVRDLR